MERPDRLWDFGTHCVILEVDENQHSERACVCEVVRMVNIHQSLGGARVVFIRYNPDVYDKKKRLIVCKEDGHIGAMDKALINAREIRRVHGSPWVCE